jgi:hypothetical protein
MNDNVCGMNEDLQNYLRFPKTPGSLSRPKQRKKLSSIMIYPLMDEFTSDEWSFE